MWLSIQNATTPNWPVDWGGCCKSIRWYSEENAFLSSRKTHLQGLYAQPELLTEIKITAQL